MNDGTAEMPTEMMTFWRPTPRIATSDSARRNPGNESRMSAKRWITRSVKPALEPRDRAERHADRDAEPDREEADQEREPAAVEESGQHVAPEMVGAERVRPRDGPEGLRQALALRIVGGEERARRRRGPGARPAGSAPPSRFDGGGSAASSLGAGGARDGPAGAVSTARAFRRSGFEGRWRHRGGRPRGSSG